MKKILQHFIIATLSLYFISNIVSGLIFERGITSLFLAGAGLAVSYLLIKPVINVLLIPINLVTFGLFRWVSSTIALYLVTLVVPGFKIIHFAFSGYSTKYFSFPALEFSGILAIIAFSFLISLFTSFLTWLID
jgi:putative membrane protein